MQWKSWDLNLKVLLIGETVVNILSWMYFPFITLYFSETLGLATAGILMTVPPLIGIIGNMLGGHLSDELGRRPSMLLGTFLRIGMFALFAMSTSHWIDYLAFIGISLGGSIYNPASFAMVTDLTQEKDRRKVFATFVTGKNLGAVLGPALGSFFFFHYRSQLLWICTIITLSHSIGIFFIIRETFSKSSKKVENVLKEQWKNYAVIFRDKIFALYIAAGIFVMIAIMQLDLYLAVYVKNYVPAQTLFSVKNWSLRLSSVQIYGWMVGLNGLLFVLGPLPVTKWFEKWSDRNMLILSAVLYGFGMFLLGFTTNIWLLLGFMVILTAGEVLQSPVTRSFVSKYAPENARGRYMAAASLQFSIGRFIAPLAVVLSAWMSPIKVFGMLFLCTLISAVLYVVVFQKLPANRQDGQKGAVS